MPTMFDGTGRIPATHERWNKEMKLGRLAYEAHGRVVGNHTPWWMLKTEERVAWAAAAEAAKKG